jgi:hypothetical protein
MPQQRAQAIASPGQSVTGLLANTPSKVEHQFLVVNTFFYL